MNPVLDLSLHLPPPAVRRLVIVYYDVSALRPIAIVSGHDWPGGQFDYTTDSPPGEIHITRIPGSDRPPVFSHSHGIDHGIVFRVIAAAAEAGSAAKGSQLRFAITDRRDLPDTITNSTVVSSRTVG